MLTTQRGDALTDRQREVLQAIADLTCERGSPPTFREVMDRMEIASPNGVNVHLLALARKGMVLAKVGEAGHSRRNTCLTPLARAELRGADAVNARVRLRLLTPEESLAPEEARRLARDLLAAADRAEAQAAEADSEGGEL